MFRRLDYILADWPLLHHLQLTLSSKYALERYRRLAAIALPPPTAATSFGSNSTAVLLAGIVDVSCPPILPLSSRLSMANTNTDPKRLYDLGAAD